MRNNKVQKLSNIVFLFRIYQICASNRFLYWNISFCFCLSSLRNTKDHCVYFCEAIYGARFSRVNGEKLGKVEVRAIFCFYLFTNVVDLFLSIHYAPTGILCFHWKAICGKIELFFETSLTPFFVNTNGPSTIKVNFYRFFNYF